MKQITLLALAAALFISCSDDDTNNVSIDGNWKLTYVKLSEDLDDEVRDWNGDGVISENALDETDCFDQAGIIFGEAEALFALNCSFSESSGSEMTTYIVTDDTVEFTYHVTQVPGITKKTTYKRQGNKLTATFGSHDDLSYIPGDGENGDSNSPFQGATYIYTKR